MQWHNRSEKIAVCAMYAALALIFSYIEAILPLNTGIPGVKLGIANLVVILALYNMNFKYAMAVNVIRILTAGLLFNGFFGAIYSLAGGITSLTVMWLLKKTGFFSITGVSMAGGVAHNMGQLLIASALVSNLRMFIYLPVLMFSGIAAGILIGITAALLNERVPKHVFRK